MVSSQNEGKTICGVTTEFWYKHYILWGEKARHILVRHRGTFQPDTGMHTASKWVLWVRSIHSWCVQPSSNPGFQVRVMLPMFSVWKQTTAGPGMSHNVTNWQFRSITRLNAECSLSLVCSSPANAILSQSATQNLSGYKYLDDIMLPVRSEHVL